jgi:Protein of unknown function (DUF2971)
MRVYHFLSTRYALEDIAYRRIRISRYADLNDPFELLATNVRDRNTRRIVREWKTKFDRTTGLLCFSKSWRNTVLWSHYASKHRGICLGFELNSSLARPILYSESRLEVEFKNKDPRQGLDRQFVRRLVRTKYAHWRYEREIRILPRLEDAVLEGTSWFLPFSKELSLREVILGPLCVKSVDKTRAIVDRLYGSVSVHKARLAFLEFKVVKDRRYEKL